MRGEPRAATQAMEDLRKLVPVRTGPATHGKAFIEVRCYCDFEGHGLASETWEEHWEVRLPLVPRHWQSTSGWQPVAGQVGMGFHGRTWADVVESAVAFMEWYRSEEAKP